MKDSKLGKLKVNNDSGDISTTHIEFTNGKVNNDSGDIELSKSVPDQPLYVSNDSGDITLNYQHHPKNTTFIAHNDSGESKFDNKGFKRHRIGKGTITSRCLMTLGISTCNKINFRGQN